MPSEGTTGNVRRAEPPWLERLQVMPLGVSAALTTRGAADDPFDLGTAIGPLAAVRQRRAAFASALPATAGWLKQVHGVGVVRLGNGPAETLPEADGSWTSEPGVACTVLVADCLPVLLATHDGRAVAAAHAGWRGLVSGVLEATVEAVCTGVDAPPRQLRAWLGPCIGPRCFEVGRDVFDAFTGAGDDPRHFVLRPRADGSARWLADLPALASDRLRQAGLVDIHIDGRCTVEQASAFFSFRRDGVRGPTGRMAAAIWRNGAT